MTDSMQQRIRLLLPGSPQAQEVSALRSSAVSVRKDVIRYISELVQTRVAMIDFVLRHEEKLAEQVCSMLQTLVAQSPQARTYLEEIATEKEDGCAMLADRKAMAALLLECAAAQLHAAPEEAVPECKVAAGWDRAGFIDSERLKTLQSEPPGAELAKVLLNIACLLNYNSWREPRNNIFRTQLMQLGLNATTRPQLIELASSTELLESTHYMILDAIHPNPELPPSGTALEKHFPGGPLLDGSPLKTELSRLMDAGIAFFSLAERRRALISELLADLRAAQDHSSTGVRDNSQISDPWMREVSRYTNGTQCDTITIERLHVVFDGFLAPEILSQLCSEEKRDRLWLATQQLHGLLFSEEGFFAVRDRLVLGMSALALNDEVRSSLTDMSFSTRARAHWRRDILENDPDWVRLELAAPASEKSTERVPADERAYLERVPKITSVVGHYLALGRFMGLLRNGRKPSQLRSELAEGIANDKLRVELPAEQYVPRLVDIVELARHQARRERGEKRGGNGSTHAHEFSNGGGYDSQNEELTQMLVSIISLTSKDRARCLTRADKWVRAAPKDGLEDMPVFEPDELTSPDGYTVALRELCTVAQRSTVLRDALLEALRNHQQLQDDLVVKLLSPRQQLQSLGQLVWLFSQLETSEQGLTLAASIIDLARSDQRTLSELHANNQHFISALHDPLMLAAIIYQAVISTREELRLCADPNLELELSLRGLQNALRELQSESASHAARFRGIKSDVATFYTPEYEARLQGLIAEASERSLVEKLKQSGKSILAPDLAPLPVIRVVRTKDLPHANTPLGYHHALQRSTRRAAALPKGESLPPGEIVRLQSLVEEHPQRIEFIRGLPASQVLPGLIDLALSGQSGAANLQSLLVTFARESQRGAPLLQRCRGAKSEEGDSIFESKAPKVAHANEVPQVDSSLHEAPDALAVLLFELQKAALDARSGDISAAQRRDFVAGVLLKSLLHLNFSGKLQTSDIAPLEALTILTHLLHLTDKGDSRRKNAHVIISAIGELCRCNPQFKSALIRSLAKDETPRITSHHDNLLPTLAAQYHSIFGGSDPAQGVDGLLNAMIDFANVERKLPAGEEIRNVLIQLLAHPFVARYAERRLAHPDESETFKTFLRTIAVQANCALLKPLALRGVGGVNKQREPLDGAPRDTRPWPRPCYATGTHFRANKHIEKTAPSTSKDTRITQEILSSLEQTLAPIFAHESGRGFAPIALAKLDNLVLRMEQKFGRTTNEFAGDRPKINLERQIQFLLPEPAILSLLDAVVARDKVGEQARKVLYEMIAILITRTIPVDAGKRGKSRSAFDTLIDCMYEFNSPAHVRLAAVQLARCGPLMRPELLAMQASLLDPKRAIEHGLFMALHLENLGDRANALHFVFGAIEQSSELRKQFIASLLPDTHGNIPCLQAIAGRINAAMARAKIPQGSPEEAFFSEFRSRVLKDGLFELIRGMIYYSAVPILQRGNSCTLTSGALIVELAKNLSIAEILAELTYYGEYSRENETCKRKARIIVGDVIPHLDLSAASQRLRNFVPIVLETEKPVATLGPRSNLPPFDPATQEWPDGRGFFRSEEPGVEALHDFYEQEEKTGHSGKNRDKAQGS